MKNVVTIAVPSHPRYLAVVRAVTGRMAEICAIAPTEVEGLRLAVDEACSNVIKYAYGGDEDKRIVLRFRVSKRFFEVLIDDRGVKADPSVIRGRSLDDVRPGGLGMHLINRSFDIVSFDEKRGRGNRLRLRRILGKR